MSFELIELPYSADALAPAISAETLSYHHGKHHRAYVEKAGKAIAGTDRAGLALEALIAAARASGEQGLFNNAAQAWNHAFYWHSMTPESGHPSGELEAMIAADFGSKEDLASKLAQAGSGHFASGWVWLAERSGHLSIEETHDADTLADGDFNPLLVLDVWEHAYYLDHQNNRGDYLKLITEAHLNWSFASENLARGTVWEYPC